MGAGGCWGPAGAGELWELGSHGKRWGGAGAMLACRNKMVGALVTAAAARGEAPVRACRNKMVGAEGPVGLLLGWWAGFLLGWRARRELAGGARWLAGLAGGRKGAGAVPCVPK